MNLRFLISASTCFAVGDMEGFLNFYIGSVSYFVAFDVFVSLWTSQKSIYCLQSLYALSKTSLRILIFLGNCRVHLFRLLFLSFLSVLRFSKEANFALLQLTSDIAYTEPHKFLKGQKLAPRSALRLHGTRGTRQVFKRRAILQSETEFARFRV